MESITIQNKKIFEWNIEEKSLTANKGPISTSNPRSLKADAITLAPRSCPSCPTFATSIRGRRPSILENFYSNNN
jgi:hypothetical protein